MLESLISSKLRIKLLHKFLINPQITSYLRGLESEMQVSSNAVRQELNKLEEAGLLEASTEGNKKVYKANQHHPLFDDLRRILMKSVGIEHILDKIVLRLGKPQKVYITGALAQGLDSQIIDLLIIGEVDHNYLHNLALKAESLLFKKIRYALYHPGEWQESLLPASGALLIFDDRKNT